MLNVLSALECAQAKPQKSHDARTTPMQDRRGTAERGWCLNATGHWITHPRDAGVAPEGRANQDAGATPGHSEESRAGREASESDSMVIHGRLLPSPRGAL
jgi:hypothetical protein